MSTKRVMVVENPTLDLDRAGTTCALSQKEALLNRLHPRR